MKLFWKLLLSLIVGLLCFQGMITAFHLLNLPSNRAVLGGISLLLLDAVAGVVLYRNIWKRRL